MSKTNAEITVLDNGLNLSRAAAIEIVDGENDQFVNVERRIIDRGRWSLIYEAIFRWTQTGQHYRFRYRRPATERQEEGPYDYDKEPIFVPRVVAVPTQVLMWKTREEAGK